MKDPLYSMLSDYYIPYLQGETNCWFSSYTNYRFYPEMVSAGILRKEEIQMIIDFRKQKGGDFCGASRFIYGNMPEVIDNWPLYNYLWALLHNSNVREFIMSVYSHMTFHQARGSFFAPEATFYDRLDKIHCVPSQLIVPLAARWMLVFEEYDKKIIHLNRVGPKHYLDEAGKYVSIEKVPTKYGRLSFSASRLSENEWNIKLNAEFNELPEKVIIHLRALDLPEDTAISSSVDLDHDIEKQELTIFPQSKQYECSLNIK